MIFALHNCLVKPHIVKIIFNNINLVVISKYFSFKEFILPGGSLPAVNDGTALGTENTGGALGDCTTDSFSVSGGTGSSSPVICGINTGQHSEFCNILYVGSRYPC